MTEVEKTYRLRAYFTYSGKCIHVDHDLTDTLSNLFLVVCTARHAVLEDASSFIPTRVVAWQWIRVPNALAGIPGTMRLSEPIVRFDTLEQAVAYIDITQT